jgi:hypothetical protein
VKGLAGKPFDVEVEGSNASPRFRIASLRESSPFGKTAVLSREGFRNFLRRLESFEVTAFVRRNVQIT